jgi:hypothetical protein
MIQYQDSGLRKFNNNNWLPFDNLERKEQSA